jgi:AmmeMemoRadiSam system protein B/AmmeMemoRadiSam system protein A
MKLLNLAFLLLFCIFIQETGLAKTDDVSVGIREPAFAGKFYPSEPGKLTAAIKQFLKDAVPPVGSKPIALIAPHAGYIFSGQICADAFNQAAGHDYDVIVLLGTNHRAAGLDGISVYPKGGFKTPLGTARIDEELAARLMQNDKDVRYYAPAHEEEHSIEVLVPYVQTLFPGVKILPAAVGTQDPEKCGRFGKVLADVLKNRRPLIAASSDLSHYPEYSDAIKADQKTLESMLTLDPLKVRAAIEETEGKGISNLSTCACGQAPILAVMWAAKGLGADCGKILSYANSGDCAVGNGERVVGYGAVMFSAEKNCPPKNPDLFLKPSDVPDSINKAQKQALLSFARKNITQYFASETTPLARGFEPVLQNRQGAFVTLKKHGELRGCIGHMAQDTPLCRVVGAMAIQAAFNDRRFSPLSSAELSDVEIEISVLTPFREVEGPQAIRVGQDGVLIQKEGRSAVFLPQVAPEQGWNREQLLENLCRKAGLPSDAWKEKARLSTFQAVVFSESNMADTSH